RVCAGTGAEAGRSSAQTGHDAGEFRAEEKIHRRWRRGRQTRQREGVLFSAKGKAETIWRKSQLLGERIRVETFLHRARPFHVSHKIDIFSSHVFDIDLGSGARVARRKQSGEHSRVCGAAQIISEEELRQKLSLGRPLRVKLGVDPTSADIHLGHTIVLRKLRQFQDLGHTAVLIIGDFTGMIGDPSGRSATRPHLSHDEVLANAKTYREQAFKILDPARTETVCNGDWFRAMSFEDVIRLHSRVTLQQMLQRDDFRDRLEKHQAIHAHEIQYRIMQAWDSVMVKADVELGGTDQLFNVLLGREFQREQGMPQQVAFLLPILEGLDGVHKMSKSLGNYVAVNEPAAEMFGKLMSISDELMARYYQLLLGRTVPADANPVEAKKQLACEIVRTYHSADVARKTLDDWNTRFSRRDLKQ